MFKTYHVKRVLVSEMSFDVPGKDLCVSWKVVDVAKLK